LRSLVRMPVTPWRPRLRHAVTGSAFAWGYLAWPALICVAGHVIGTMSQATWPTPIPIR
jgi:hypothetical protein